MKETFLRKMKKTFKGIRVKTLNNSLRMVILLMLQLQKMLSYDGCYPSKNSSVSCTCHNGGHN